MQNVFVKKTIDGFSFKIWRGEYMFLLAFDVEAPDDDFVGFAIAVKSPNSDKFYYLRNRIAFDYANKEAVNGFRLFSSLEAPIQKFRWLHFPYDPKDGIYTYKATMMHMDENDVLREGKTIELPIEVQNQTIDGLLDVGFTRNFASSQAYNDKFGSHKNIIPKYSHDGLEFQKPNLIDNYSKKSVYDWLGFKAKEKIDYFLDNALAKGNEIKIMLYDFNEPDLLFKFKSFGAKLKAIIDDSGNENKGSSKHINPFSAESKAAKRLEENGCKVKRTHFKGLQHNKVFIEIENGKPIKALFGSTNFSYRGIYIQANNVIVFENEEVAGLFNQMFEIAWDNPDDFAKNDFAKKWHEITQNGLPKMEFCFSPHKDSDLSMVKLADVIKNCKESLFYSIAFLYQTKSGPVLPALMAVEQNPNILNYGTSDKNGKLTLHKPDGSFGLVSFASLSKFAPSPFKEEWSGQGGINIHHKFVVADFHTEDATVFLGSSNLAPSGEEKNGDNLMMIKDQRIAVSYALEAMRVFDHLQFRVKMKEGDNKENYVIKLRKPPRNPNEYTWFKSYYKPNSQKLRDRILFAK
ncbi:MAG: hypothetical protein J0L55_06975 [Caulobacterales bacterium]|nr:hypothetical protein [Caulobacterales bacterium]MCA0373243.1 phospholipase D-like domain-containing protein [Pseudomonadota bacterium]